MAQEYFLYTTEYNNTLIERSNNSFAPLPPNTGEIFIDFFIPTNQPLYYYRESGGTIVINDENTIEEYLSVTVPPTDEEILFTGYTATTQQQIDQLGVSNSFYAFSKTSASGSQLDGYGLNISRPSTGVYDYTFDIPLLNANYGILAQPFETTTDTNVHISLVTVNGFRLTIGLGDNGTAPDVPTDTEHSVGVFGVPISGNTNPAVGISDFTGYTANTKVEIDNKINKVSDATGNVGTFTSDGNLENSGFSISDLTGGTGMADGVVSGATLNNTILELKRTQGLPDVTVDLVSLSGGSDGVVSGGTLNGSILVLKRTEGLSDVTVDLVSLTGNSLSITDFNAYSATTDTRISNIEDSIAELPTGLTAVQIRRSTDFLLPGTWGDITFDSIDFQNDPDILSADTTNTDRIIVGQNGLYLLAYDGVGSDGSELRFRINDTTIIDASIKSVFSTVTGIAAITTQHDISNQVILKLNQGDFITLQGQRVGATLLANASVKVIKLDSARGSKGEKGETGAGSNVNVFNNGVNPSPTGGSYSILNLGDGITAIDAGDGQTVNISATTSNNPTQNIIQLIDTVGGLSTNNVTPVVVPWSSQDFIDGSVFNHTLNSGLITVLQNGTYKLSYSLRTNSANNTRGNQGVSFQLNGSSFINPTTSASYKRNIANGDTSNELSSFLITLNVNDTLELVAYRLGDAANLLTVANESFINIEYLG